MTSAAEVPRQRLHRSRRREVQGDALMTLSATEKRKRPVEAGGRSSRILAAMILVSALIAVRLRRQAAAAGGRGARRRSRSRSRSSAPSPIGMNSPAGSRRSRKCRSAPASAASSPVVEFRDGAIVHAGDLLYVIDPRPFEAVALQADGQLVRCARQGRTGQTRTRSRADLGPDQCGLRIHRRPAPPDPAGGACRGDAGRRRAEGGASSTSNSPM